MAENNSVTFLTTSFDNPDLEVTTCLKQNKFMAIVTLLAIISAVVLNLVAFVNIYNLSPRKQDNIPHLFIGSLAMVSLLMVILTYPLSFAEQLKGNLYDEDDPVCYFTAFIFLWAGNVIVLITVLMSVERCLAIRWPFKHTAIFNFNLAVKLLIGIVLYSCCLSSIPLFLRVIVKYPEGVCLYSQDDDGTIRGKIVIFLYVLNYILSWIVMAIANTLLLLTMRDLRKTAKSAAGGSVRRPYRQSSSWDKQKRDTLKFSRLIMVMSFCYSLSWLPFTVKVLLKHYLNWDNCIFDMMTISLAGCDPIINPLVCVIMSKSFRKGYRKTVVNAFKCACKERDGLRSMELLPGTLRIRNQDRVMAPFMMNVLTKIFKR
ncbi:neurotensin receptor type 1-like isoform X2 [Antedon mediterranea]|uniref:neurotensin receptor type 1-like isoform X2 n=1 Tax=Antedon mediterranea TaxID=105859 RepID=UPI003AF7AC07